MLTHLSIQNFAVVKSLHVELHGGLTAITGETGAGKSIMVDALCLILGDRADNGVIRDGADRAEICAVFDISENPLAHQWLEYQDLGEEECIIRRSLTTDGRSRAFINDRPMTLSQVRELGETLLDIHSQHEHQSLMSKNEHRRLLDEYAGATDLMLQVQSNYQKWISLKEQLTQLTLGTQQQKDQQELIRYQLEELNNLNLVEGEIELLEQEQTQLANAEQILSVGQNIVTICRNHGADESGGDCHSQLSNAISLSQQLRLPEHHQRNSIELLQNAQIQIEEACDNLRDYLESVEVNPERLLLVEQRLSDAHQLARKHRIQPAELPELRLKLESNLEELANVDEALLQLETDIESALRAYSDKSHQLSKIRSKSAQQLNQVIISHLEAMGMKGCTFITQLTPLAEEKPSASGAETVEFLVSANPGQAPKPLRKVASGGELSRISLAIQVVLANKTNAATLIFDEVDVGIGGGTSEVVGQLLRQLGAKGQVICVTHQPQVAAMAHHHLAVTKQTESAFTDSRVVTLSAEDKITEVARMLGGLKLTKQTIAHATEMIKNTVPD